MVSMVLALHVGNISLQLAYLVLCHLLFQVAEHH